MGIRGLYSYIQDYADAALEWHKLQKCKLVIDGNNLAHEIYSNSPGINTAFGGDYDKYAAHIEKFFSKLFECEVEPIIIMDGGYPLHRNKFATVYSRLTIQLETAMAVNPDNQNVMKIFPIMGRSVFVSVAQKLGITVLQADFEADDEIAVLAKKLGAYVLSNDSDFYLFDVPFILLHSVNMKHIQKEHTAEGKCQKFIPCYRFAVDSFCKMTGVRKELLPLLAPILGNDFINAKIMEGFYSRIADLRPVAKGIPHRKKIIISVIKWLAKQDGSAEEILERIIDLKAMWLSRRSKEALRNTLHMYSPKSGYLKSWVYPHKKSCPSLNDKDTTDFKNDWFSSKSIAKEFCCTCGSRTSTTFVSIGKMPDWFIRAYRLHLIPHTITDILTKDYLFTVPMIEVLEYKSLYLRLEMLIKKIRGILWSTCAHGLSLQITGVDTLSRDNKVDSGFFMRNLKGKKHVYSNKVDVPSDTDDEDENVSSNNDVLSHRDVASNKDDKNENISSVIDVSVRGDSNYSSISKDTENINIEVIDSLDDKTDTKYQPENIDTKYLDTEINNRLDNENYGTKTELAIDKNNKNSDSLYDEDVIATLDMHYYKTPPNDKNVNEKLIDNSSSKPNFVDDEDDYISDDNADENNEIIDDSSDDLGYDKEENKNAKNITKIHYIPPLRMYIRDGERLNPKTFPQENVHAYKKFPSLFKIDKWTQVEKKNLFYNTIGVDMNLKDEVLSSNIEFILLSICLWKKLFDKHVDMDVIFSVLMCVVMYSIIDPKIGRVRSKGSPEEVIRFLDRIKIKKESDCLPEASSLSLENLIQNLSVEECRLASISLNQFHKLDPKANRRNYDRVVIHAFSEYQATVYFLQYLNSLLYFPFPMISMDCIWNGTFCYNIYNCFSPSKNPNTVLPTIFDGNDRVSYLFFKLYSVIQLSLNLPQFEINFSSLSVSKIRSKMLVKKKKLSAKNSRRSVKAPKGGAAELQADKLEDPTEEDLEALAENKFAALLII